MPMVLEKISKQWTAIGKIMKEVFNSKEKPASLAILAPKIMALILK
jgi:hypothetical protein